MEEVDALKVGQMFVMQYYTQMHKDAQQMVRFYLETSSIVRGGCESGSAEVITGSKAIHEKFTSLGLQQVHAKIKQMDSTISLGNEIGPGIVIQVTGELSVSGNMMRPFVQTFVLAPESPKKYYIHNDIFRYQIYDEDLTSDVESQEPNPELEVELNDANSTTVPEDALYNRMQESNMPPESPENITSNGLPEETHESPILVEESSYPMENVDNEVTPTPDVSFHPEIEEITEPTGTSWAARISKNIPGSSMGKVVVTTTPATPPQGPGMPQRGEPRQQPRRGQHPAGERSTPERKIPPPMLGRGAPDSCQIFVGGLPSGTTDVDLRAVFDQFGTVMEVRINPKNFGFVVFDSEIAVHKVMEAKEENPIKIHLKQLNIEQKRPAGSRGGGGPGPRKSLPQAFSRGPRGTSKPIRRN